MQQTTIYPTGRPADYVAEEPAGQRPADRAAADATTLSDSELIAALLSAAPKGFDSTTDFARNLLARAGGLAGLSPYLISNAHELRGTQRGRIAAAVELARRLARAELPDRLPLAHPEAVARYLLLRYAERDQEVMGALFLDVRNRLLGEAELFRGTLARAAVEPRAILKQALLRSAAGVLLFHTHPSGDPSPSAEDLAFTRRLSEAGELLGVRLLDHLILGTGHRWVSLSRRGGW
jgi:DNA repair protein RadC